MLHAVSIINLFFARQFSNSKSAVLLQFGRPNFEGFIRTAYQLPSGNPPGSNRRAGADWRGADCRPASYPLAQCLD
jgi:hypothetical protein